MRSAIIEADVVRDVAEGKKSAPKSRKESVTVRLPLDLTTELRTEASRREIPLGVVIEERCRHRILRLSSTVLQDARPWSEAAYHVSQALTFERQGNPYQLGRELIAARNVIVGQLKRLDVDHDSDLDVQEATHPDDWGGLHHPRKTKKR